MNLRQLSAFVAITEEGSFNRAARRLNATQSGLSMQIKLLEERLGVRLFDRSTQGVRTTVSGDRLYATAVEVMRDLDRVGAELKALSGAIAGPLRLGLMPTFTRGMLAPVLERFLSCHPDVNVSVVEAYSAELVDKVLEGKTDFAVVPRQTPRQGLRMRPLGEDREIFVQRPGGSVPHLTPVRLADLGPLRLILPERGNARRDRLEVYLIGEDLPVTTILGIDAMSATLDLVAQTDWATILPESICGKDLDGRERWLHPILPELTVPYVVAEPARRALSPAAMAFLEMLEVQYRRSQADWAAAVEAASVR